MKMKMVSNIMDTMDATQYHMLIYIQGSGNVECVSSLMTSVLRAGGWSATNVPAGFTQSV